MNRFDGGGGRALSVDDLGPEHRSAIRVGIPKLDDGVVGVDILWIFVWRLTGIEDPNHSARIKCKWQIRVGIAN